MTDLDRIQIQRAEEQMETVRMDEPTTHDRWQIRGEDSGRAPRWRRASCLAGDCDSKPTHHGYCHMHWQRVESGLPVDLENITLTKQEIRRLSSGLRFGVKRAEKTEHVSSPIARVMAELATKVEG